MNCKPGDLAIVIEACPDYFDAVGRIVEVIRLSPFDFGIGVYWEIKFLGITPPSLSGYGTVSFSCDDNSLKPVSGLPLEEDEIQEIKEPA